MPQQARSRRIALVGDFHGNWPATQALETDLKRRGADEIICMGDMVGKGPDSDKTFDWAMANCSVQLMGNWDGGISEKAFPMDEPYYRQLGDKRLAVLRALPLEHHFTLSGQRVRLLHGRPVMPELLTVRSDPDALRALFTVGDESFRVVGYADAHRQSLLTLDRGWLFNTGSVGNNLGVPRVCYALLDGFDSDEEAPLDITLCHLPYDRQAAIARCEGSDVARIDTFVNELETGIYSRG